MSDDPWATPEQEVQETAQAEPPAKPDTGIQVPGSDSHVLSFKGGTGYDAFLYVLKADTNKGILEQLDDPDFRQVLEKAQGIQKWNTAAFNGAPKSDGNTAPKAQPDRTGPPDGKKEYCSHGEMTYKEGVSKAGNTYKGYFCPERDRDSQCKAKFVK